MGDTQLLVELSQVRIITPSNLLMEDEGVFHQKNRGGNYSNLTQLNKELDSLVRQIHSDIYMNVHVIEKKF